MRSESVFIAFLSFCVIPYAAAQSQPATSSEQTKCTFQDHKNVSVEYGSLPANGRKIFGGFVPYGKVWETGFKRPTTLVTNANLSVGGKEVPAGTYTLSTVPGTDKWTMIFKDASGKDHSGLHEVADIDLLVKQLPSALEDFTIKFDQYRGGCVLNLRWAQTEASVLVAEK